MSDPNQLPLVGVEELNIANSFDKFASALLVRGRNHTLNSNEFIDVWAADWRNEPASAHSSFAYVIRRTVFVQSSAKIEVFKRNTAGVLECETSYAEQDIGNEFGVDPDTINTHAVDQTELDELIDYCAAIA